MLKDKIRTQIEKQRNKDKDNKKEKLFLEFKEELEIIENKNLGEKNEVYKS